MADYSPWSCKESDTTVQIRHTHIWVIIQDDVCILIGEYLGIISAYITFFSFIFISWRLITLQYCSGFCHTLTWISHGFTCVPHPDPPSHLPPHPIPLGLPSAPALSTCLMHPTWAVICFTFDSMLVSMLFLYNF